MSNIINSKKIEQSILEKILPSSKEQEDIKNIINELLSLLSSHIKKLNINIELKVAGSVPKGTFLSNPDIDIFLLFPPSINKEDLVSIGLNIGKKIINGKKKYTNHPYITGSFKNYNIDIVPCYKIKDSTKLLTPVDRTPFHTEYIILNLTNEQKNQVRLLKQFIKGASIYGADSKYRGFSGYLCELLISYYKSFSNLITHASNWKINQQILLNEKIKNFQDPLNVPDPVDGTRNVASPVHEDSFYKFIFHCINYKKSPSETFFYPPPSFIHSKDTILNYFEEKDTKLFSLILEKPNIIEDLLYSQIYKTVSSLTRLFNDYSFNVIKSSYDIGNDKIFLIFELENDTLSTSFLHKGPFFFTNNSENFLEKWKKKGETNFFLKEGKWCVVAKRINKTVKNTVLNNIDLICIGKNFKKDTLSLFDHELTLKKIPISLISNLLFPSNF